MTDEPGSDTVVAALAAHPFTAELSEPHRRRLAGLATEQRYGPGAWIMRADAEADRFHLVVEGRAAVEVFAPGRSPMVISTVHVGQVVGWSWCLPPYRVHFDVVALDPVRTVAIDGAGLRAACEDDHELGFQVMHRLAAVLATRLESTRLQLVDVYGSAG